MIGLSTIKRWLCIGFIKWQVVASSLSLCVSASSWSLYVGETRSWSQTFASWRPLAKQFFSTLVKAVGTFFIICSPNHIIDIDSWIFFTRAGSVPMYFYRWCWIIAFSKKGLEDTLNTTLANLNVTTSGSSTVASFTHRNLNTLRSLGSTEIIRKAFSTSATTATACVLNQSNISRILWFYLGPVCKQLFSDSPVVWEEASCTTWILVVSSSCWMTAWYGR